METNKIISVNGKTIRLTQERWMHITLGHPELADYYYEILDCIYKEMINDGFIITAYISNKIQKFNKKKILWEPKK